ncbi:Protein CBG07424 [Caenorhabditis briggsae]|uniref:Protein CBG07424 n=1 Tax=Caenorhabditis briggsae TaxID=6238 RepID=A8X4T0_CAEBR|nr:Protein CBG07424 [Caenorhabditis briggsae]CAP27640.1 Protein CBG07424 [Caenorhabditis briggsae]
MNSFYIREYIEIDENNADWTKIDYKLRHGARMIVICVDFYDIYSTLYNLAVRNLSGFRFIIVIILNKPPDEVLNQPNVRNLLYGANTFIISPRQEQFSDAFSSMQRVVPTLSDEQFTQFLRIYQACYAYCVGSMYGVETQTNNYHVAMSGKIVSSKWDALDITSKPSHSLKCFEKIIELIPLAIFLAKYGAFTFDKSGSVLTDYVVYTVNPAEMTFDAVLTLKSTPKDCDTYNCFSLAETKTPDLLWSLRDMDPPDECVARNACSNYIPSCCKVYFLLLLSIIFSRIIHFTTKYCLLLAPNSTKFELNSKKTLNFKGLRDILYEVKQFIVYYLQFSWLTILFLFDKKLPRECQKDFLVDDKPLDWYSRLKLYVREYLIIKKVFFSFLYSKIQHNF